MDCLGSSDPQLAESLVPRNDKSGCCRKVDRGYQIWNAVMMLLGGVLLLEAVFCMAAGFAEEDDVFTVNVTAADEGDEIYTLADVQLAIGMCLGAVGLGQFLLGGFSICGCCSKHNACTTCLHALYFTLASLLIASEVVMALAMFVLQDWDAFKGRFKIEIAESADDMMASQDMNLVLCGFMVELILSVFVQVGAMIFHVTHNTMKQDQHGGLTATDSYGSESFTEKRLDHMRKYYAQLYVENGLQIPSELRHDD